METTMKPILNEIIKTSMRTIMKTSMNEHDEENHDGGTYFILFHHVILSPWSMALW